MQRNLRRWATSATTIVRRTGFRIGRHGSFRFQVRFGLKPQEAIGRNGQVSALSAEGRLSALILYILPFAVGFFVRLTNPEYLSELTESTAGLVAIALAIVLMAGGGVWIKKIVNVRF